MIEIASDIAELEQIAKNDKVWSWISDDSCFKEQFALDDSHYYLRIVDNGLTAGFFMVRFDGCGLAWIHTVVHPDYWGNGITYAKEVISWLFENTNIGLLATLIPEGNKNAKGLAERAGMKETGILPDSFLKNKKLLTQKIYCITRAQLCQ